MIFKFSSFWIFVTEMVLVFLSVFVFVYAEDVDKIKEKINEQQTELQKLDQEIAGYEHELTTVSRKKNTLKNSVYRLDLSRRKVNASVRKTESQIASTHKSILQMSNEIKEKEQQLHINKQALASAIRAMHEQESDTFIETFLRKDTISDVWTDIETLRRFQSVVQIKVNEIGEHKRELELSIHDAEKERNSLEDFQKKLVVQKRSLDINRAEKKKLLDVTKNKESNYQALLARKRKAREEFEKELNKYESKLHYVPDTKVLPSPGKGVLHWPLKRIHITQYFGNTAYAKSGAYNGKGHNGVDFGIALGTPVHAAQSGTITATGNTDAFPGCLSYGKWILIKHDNGLSTFYAHLSRRLVAPGDKVNVGDVIAHSGSTGYSTGPHLHFGTYLTSGVRVVKIGDIRKTRNCKQARIPIAPWKAYLNPLDYL